MTKTGTNPIFLALVVVGLSIVGTLTSLTPARALDLTGSARLWAGPVKTDFLQQDQVDQRYRLRLSQQLSPWLTVFAGYAYTDFRTDFDLGPTFERSSREPLFGLFYDRPTFSARFTGFDRAIRTTNSSQDLDVRSLQAELDWRPRWGPRFSLRIQDSNNVVDPQIFGRETDAQFLDFAILYDRQLWSARYRYQLSKTDNKTTGFKLDQGTHELRGTFGKRWWQDRLYVSLDGRVARLEQDQQIPLGTSIAQPIPVRQGLFAVDTSPAVGDLAPVPGLIDGDFDTPTTPPIDIGGANSFRNIGVDLGINRPITRLEISVDRPSGPALLWEIYQSPDNLNWAPIGGIRSAWDAGFLRYTLFLPETSNRFFKAVNLSVNGISEVLVTEIRALVDAENIEDSQSDGNEYWVDFFTSLQPHRRMELSFLASTRKDLTLGVGGLGRDRDTVDLHGQALFRLARNLDFRLGYRQTEIEEALEPTLLRDETQSNVALEWRPLPTVNVLAQASRRDETEDSDLIRSSDTILLRAATELLPDLRTTIEWSFSAIDDPFSGFEQDVNRWLVGLDTRPRESWILGANISYATYDSTGVITLTQRTNAQIYTTWLPTSYLTLSGDWTISDDNLRNSLTQRYAVGWSPGRKLSTSLSFQGTETADSASTQTITASINYRLNRWVTLWSNTSKATTDITGLTSSETKTFRLGLNLIF